MKDPVGPVKLMTAASELDADLLCGMLSGENIPYLTKARGAGTLYLSGSFSGVDLYVGAADFARAHELLTDYLPDGDEDERR